MCRAGDVAGLRCRVRCPWRSGQCQRAAVSPLSSISPAARSFHAIDRRRMSPIAHHLVHLIPVGARLENTRRHARRTGPLRGNDSFFFRAIPSMIYPDISAPTSFSQCAKILRYARKRKQFFSLIFKDKCAVRKMLFAQWHALSQIPRAISLVFVSLLRSFKIAAAIGATFHKYNACQ